MACIHFRARLARNVEIVLTPGADKVAAAVMSKDADIGFCGSDNQGLDGIEAKYDETLAGTNGAILRSTDATGESIGDQGENYSAPMAGRKTGETPITLMDFFPKDYLLVVDESHVTLPQVRGMYNGDRSRKESLVNFGFRLPSALDNRPMKFDEFESMVNQVIY